MEVTGTTYSVAHYEEFKKTGNKNLFEEIIDSMILDGVAGMNETFKNAISSLPNSEKRMTILSLIEKDLNLFKKIKALTNKDIDRMNHIKDVILMLRDYVKVGEVEKKKFGEVMTPLELIKEMLATLPEEVWSNPNLKWLDPANGTGPFPSVVIYKLMKGLEEWEPNAEKRYKHIVENMIYTCELQPKNVFLWLCVVDPFDEYETNTYCGSFLDNGFDTHMKEVWSVDKFDIVIGNPPYNFGNKKNLYIDFFKKCFKIISNFGYLTFITPSRYVIQPEFEIFRKNVENIADKVFIKNTGRSFGEQASFSTVYTTIFFGSGTIVDWLDGYDDPIVRKILSKNRFYLNTKRSKALLKNKKERDLYNDIEKPNHYRYFVNGKGLYKTPYRYLPYRKGDTFKPKVYMTEFVGTGSNKILGEIYLDTDGSVGLGTDSCMYIECSDINRLNSLKNYLSSKLISFILNKICQSSHANQTMRLIPDPTIEIKIETDEQLFDYFDLSEEERNIVLNYGKK
jgi:hypothetical protein